jgi:uncharacterized protein YqeY
VSASELKERLRADLKTALRERRPRDVAVIRTLIAAIDNAEAQPIDEFEERIRQREAVGEVGRRDLDKAALGELLAGEARSRLAAAQDYERHGRGEDAARLREEADLIALYRGQAGHDPRPAPSIGNAGDHG